jgi:hypothetical protein
LVKSPLPALQLGHNAKNGMNSKLNHIQEWAKLAQKADWSVSALAKQCRVSVRTLERYFLKVAGIKPKAWLAEQRQLQAIELLRDGSSVKETAGYLHYKHPSHLTNGLKKHWGHCPTIKAVHKAAPNA